MISFLHFVFEDEKDCQKIAKYLLKTFPVTVKNVINRAFHEARLLLVTTSVKRSIEALQISLSQSRNRALL